jgi:PadR family transcriptional regulator PadR
MEQAQLLKGVLEIAVLAVLDNGETYGYDILSRLEGAGLSGVGDASVYGTLRRLEQGGHLSSRLAPSPNGPARKYYSVTDSGRKALGAGATAWRRIESAMDGLLGGSR